MTVFLAAFGAALALMTSGNHTKATIDPVAAMVRYSPQDSECPSFQTIQCSDPLPAEAVRREFLDAAGFEWGDPREPRFQLVLSLREGATRAGSHVFAEMRCRPSSLPPIAKVTSPADVGCWTRSMRISMWHNATAEQLDEAFGPVLESLLAKESDWQTMDIVERYPHLAGIYTRYCDWPLVIKIDVKVYTVPSHQPNRYPTVWATGSRSPKPSAGELYVVPKDCTKAKLHGVEFIPYSFQD